MKGAPSPNPTGRPAAFAEVVELARTHTAEAIEGLFEIARNPRTSAVARVRAWEVLLERGWGKSPVSVSLEVRGITRAEAQLDELSDDELRRIVSAARGEPAALPPGES